MILPAASHPPDSIRTLLRNKFTYAGAPDAALPEGVRPLGFAEPQPIYTATIDALLNGPFPGSPEFSGWQYVLVVDDEPQGVVEVSEARDVLDDPDEEPGDAEAAAYDVLRPREYAVILNEVVAQAEKIKGKYELRILRIPSVYLVAVWLKPSSQKGTDWLLPVVPPSPQFLANQTFTAEQLREKLDALARQRRDTEDLSR